MSRVTKASILTSVCSCNGSSESFSSLKNLETSSVAGSSELRFNSGRSESSISCIASSPAQSLFSSSSTFRLGTTCRRFDPGGSLDRRVNCRRVPQPRWVGARRSAKGEKLEGDRRKRGNPRPSCLSRAQVRCACSRGLQASAWEGARGLRAPSRPSPRVQPSVRGPWTFLL
jgi:hypothetical protein